MPCNSSTGLARVVLLQPFAREYELLAGRHGLVHAPIEWIYEYIAARICAYFSLRLAAPCRRDGRRSQPPTKDHTIFPHSMGTSRWLTLHIDLSDTDDTFHREPARLPISAWPVGAFPADAPEPQAFSSRPSNENNRIEGQPSSDSVAPSLLALAHLPLDQLRRAMRDSDGNVWIATRESGIYRIHGNPGAMSPSVERLSVLDGLSN